MNRISYTLFLCSLIFAPLAFGTVEQWSLATVEIGAVLAMVLFFLSAWFYREKTVRVVGLVPLLLLLLVPAVQLIPLPVGLVKLISPGTYGVYAPILEASEQTRWMPLSVDRHATLHELLRLSSYAMFYIVTVQLLSTPARLKKTLNTVVLLGSGIALLAIIQRVSSPDRVYWFRAVPENAQPFGPWVNSNQFSGYMELLFPLILALFLFYRPRVKGDESLRQKIVAFFTVPSLHLQLFFGFGAMVMTLAVFVSLCRGGILSILLAAVVFLFLYNRKFPRRGRATLLIILFGCFATVSWFGWDTILAEFNQSFDASGSLRDGRLTLWKDTWEIVKTFPLLGAGFGSFLAVYPSYKTIGDNLVYDHAHNDYLELLTDGGIIAFILASWFLVRVLWHGWKMVRARRDHYAVLIGIGAITGIISTLAHSITDFNLHNGAVGLYFFFLCGVLVAGAHIRFDYLSPGSHLKKLPPSQGLGYAAGGGVLLLMVLIVQVGSFFAGYQYRQIKDIYITKHLSPERLQTIVQAMEKAVLADPLEGYYSYKLGVALWYLEQPGQTRLRYLDAAMKQPLEGAFLQQLGFVQDDPEVAQKLIDEGFHRALHKDALAVNYAEWLLWKGNREEAFSVLRSRLNEDHEMLVTWMPLLNGFSVTREELATLLPPKVEAWIFFGRYCERQPDMDDCGYFFEKALTLIPATGEVDDTWYKHPISFYQRTGQQDAMLRVLRQAMERLPDDAKLHMILGDYYMQQGITYRAKEEYERVLVLDPGNRTARSQLRRMGFEDSY